jgi:hypothetical protein
MRGLRTTTCRSELDARAALVDSDDEKLWQTEILRRAREIDEGSV